MPYATNLPVLREELIAKQSSLDSIFRKYTSVENMPADTKAEATALANAVTDLRLEVERAKSAEDASGTKRGGMPPQPGIGMSAGDPGAFGRAVIESDVFKRFDFRTRGLQSQAIDIPLSALESKNTITATQFAPQAVRDSLVLPKAVEGLHVADLFSLGTTDQNSVVYMEETTLTNNAAETAEGAAKPESDLVFTEKTSPVRKIATYLRVSDEMLADVNGFGAYIAERVPMMVKMREDGQLLTGDGVSPNLTGILNASGLQTQAKGAFSTPDAIYKAITLIRQNAFMEPDAIVIHPADWEAIRLLTTTDGAYVFGAPAVAGAETLFGLKVVITTRMTQNTAIVGAFKTAAKLVRREALRVSLSTEDASNFTTNLVTVLAELREALVIYRGAAFCSVTGI